jgi:hypothetical protein
MSKRKREAQIFVDANVDPEAPIDPEIDAEINEIARKKAATEELHDILSRTTEIHEKATGKKGGKRRKTRKGSKKSKKMKSTFKKSRAKRRTK